VDEPRDVAETGGLVDEGADGVAGGDVDGGGVDGEARVGQVVGGGVCVVLVEVGEQDVFAGPTRRAMAWPMEPGPVTMRTSVMSFS
jgi:hypothetical protein